MYLTCSIPWSWRAGRGRSVKNVDRGVKLYIWLVLVAMSLDTSVVDGVQAKHSPRATTVTENNNIGCSGGMNAAAWPHRSAKKNITVGFLHDGKGSKTNKYYVGAMSYALKVINTQHRLHGDHDLVMQYYSYKAGDKVDVVRGMTKLREEDGVAAYIGPGDTCSHEALVSMAWNIPMISFKCRDSEVKYETFVRTIPSTSPVSKSIISVMKNFDWKEATALSSTSDTWRQTAQMLETLGVENGITIRSETYEYKDPKTFKDQFEDKTIAFKRIIQKTLGTTRVYIFLGGRFAVIDFVRAVEDSGLNAKGEYAIIVVSDRMDTAKYFKKFIDKKARVRPFRPVLMIMPRPPSNPVQYQRFKDETLCYSTKEPLYGLPSLEEYKAFPVKLPVPIFAAYLYDAVMAYAHALNETLKGEGGDYRNGTAVISRILGWTYESIQGFDMYMDKEGYSESNYTVMALKPLLPTEIDQTDKLTHGFKMVGSFSSSGDSIPVYHQDDTIDWIGGAPPPSKPKCGFTGEDCMSKGISESWTVAIVCTVVTTIVVFLTVYGCRCLYNSLRKKRKSGKVYAQPSKGFSPESSTICHECQKSLV